MLSGAPPRNAVHHSWCIASAEELMKTKLQTLVESEGFASVQDLPEATITDSVSPAICMNDGCSYTCEMEPDRDHLISAVGASAGSAPTPVAPSRAARATPVLV